MDGEKDEWAEESGWKEISKINKQDYREKTEWKHRF